MRWRTLVPSIQIMIRCRAALSVLMGLVLLVQGFAVSAASRTNFSDKAPVSASVVAVPPCHGQMAMQPNDSGEQQPSCCNENCPDMTTCALGHLASAASVSVTLPLPLGAERTFMAVPPASRTHSSLLRPPIALHG